MIVQGIKVGAAVYLCVVLALSGCTSVDPYAFEARGQNPGAQANAMTRAVLGQSLSAEAEPLTGPMASEGSDQYMRLQEQELKEQLTDSGVMIERVDNQIRLIMPGQITFASDSQALHPDFLSVLDSVAKTLSRFDRTRIDVSGHTDSRGKEAYNQRLSEARAQVVADYLREQGVDSDRVRVFGRGEKYPLATNDTQSGRAKNRRVELSVHGR